MLTFKKVALQMFGVTTTVGIDIGTSAVRAALLQQGSKSVALKTLLVVPYEVETLEAVLRGLKKQISKACSMPWHWPKHQIMGVPQSSVAVKRFPPLADVPDHEQFVQVGLQLSESLGLPIDELLYDYHVLDDKSATEVYACRKSMLNETLNGLESAGFELSVIELHTQALMRLYREQSGHQLMQGIGLLVDVGSERLQICMGDGQSGQFYRELPAPVLSGASDAKLARQHFTEQLADVIKRHYQLAATQLSGAEVSHVWLSGESAKSVDISLLETCLSWPTQALNPLQGLVYSPNIIEQLNEPVSAWSTAIGLALRGVSHDRQY
ncbi:pilus assembly protein PilM [Enterovibrio norvegicus FF-33]|uniref:type IV pilus biogenesis protein PilM n=1 Tax=Enterovibrio TaxID=188143 RepID=UPI00035FA37B|nr:pilus assembly protein PilM [Enterovibrio norvegicus]OEE68838.1 pilus assembly protein PilM [Enterovibrio norvegicus FF-33]